MYFSCSRSIMFFRRSKEPKRPAQAKTVILRFAHKSQATFLGHTKFASNNFSSKYRGQKNSLFTEKQQHDMHRSNNICPISAIWTVVCCVFDSAGFYWNYLCWRKCFLHLIEKITPIHQTLQVNRPCRLLGLYSTNRVSIAWNSLLKKVAMPTLGSVGCDG